MHRHTAVRTWLRITMAVVTTAMLGTGLAACSSSANSSSSSTQQALEKGGTITYWTWTPQAQAQVAAFEKTYPKVKVNLVNAGTGTTEYTKLQNVIKAGSGAPDVAQIEYFALPQFALSNSLVDLTQYGFDSLKSDYSAGPWSSVNIDGKLVGLPQDSGPMAMFYNKTVFDKYGLTVPTTWDQYVADAQKLHAANPNAYITSDTGDPGFTTSMIWQAGGHPFQSNGTKVTINLQDSGSTKWTSVWNTLVENKLLAPIPGWTDQWYQALGDGTIATLPTGAWMPGVLESSVKNGSGQWRVAPLPKYSGSAGNSENGGSSQVVLKQSKNQALAAGFVKWLNNSQQSISVFMQNGGFPSTVKQLNESSFLNQTSAYFGGQKINQILSSAAKDVLTGWEYLPFQVYANSVFSDTVGQSYQSNSSLDPGLQEWQKELVQYGNQQGFTVTGK